MESVTSLLNRMFSPLYYHNFNFQAEFQEKLDDSTAVRGKINWQRNPEGDPPFLEVGLTFSENHSDDLTQQAKIRLKNLIEEYGDSLGIEFLFFDTVNHKFTFRLPQPHERKTSPKKTRQTLTDIIKNQHPHFLLTTHDSLTDFAEYQTPLVNTTLRSIKGRNDTIYQRYMDNHKERLEQHYNSNDIATWKKTDRCIYHWLNLLAYFSIIDHGTVKLELLTELQQSPLLRPIFNEIALVIKFPDQVEKVIEKHTHELTAEQKNNLKFIAKNTGFATVETILANQEEYGDYLNSQLMELTNSFMFFINELLIMDNSLKASLNLAENITFEELKNAWQLDKLFPCLKDYKGNIKDLDTNLLLEGIDWNSLKEIKWLVKKVTKIIYNHLIENNYPSSTYFTQIELDKIPPAFLINVKPNLDNLNVPLAIREHLITCLAWDLHDLNLGIGSHRCQLVGDPLEKLDDLANHQYGYQWDTLFEPTLRLSAASYEMLNQQVEKNCSVKVYGTHSSSLMEETCLINLLDFYDEIVNKETGIKQPQTPYYYPALLKYNLTEDQRGLPKKVEVTVIDKGSKLFNTTENFYVEANQIHSSGKRPITYALMAQSFKKAGAKAVKISIDLTDLESNSRFSQTRIREVALERLTLFAQELTKRKIDFVLGALPPKVGNITQADIQMSLDKQVYQSNNSSFHSGKVIR